MTTLFRDGASYSVIGNDNDEIEVWEANHGVVPQNQFEIEKIDACKKLYYVCEEYFENPMTINISSMNCSGNFHLTFFQRVQSKKCHSFGQQTNLRFQHECVWQFARKIECLDNSYLNTEILQMDTASERFDPLCMYTITTNVVPSEYGSRKAGLKINSFDLHDFFKDGLKFLLMYKATDFVEG